MKLFIAYPYQFNEHGYREALSSEFAGTDVTLTYADERLANDHVLYKIRDMMAEADACMFDISGNNPNVMLELGIALGEDHPGFVAVNAVDVGAIGADVVGWDQLRYKTFADLAKQLRGYVAKGAIPVRRRVSDESRFGTEIETDDETFFNQIIMPGIAGYFDLLVRPITYDESLIPRIDVRKTLREFEAAYRVRSNIADSIPYDIANCTIENFADGASFAYRHNEWARWEAARLHTSGLYRIMRVMRDDFGPDRVLRQTDQTIGVVDLIEQVTLFHLLARNVARRIVAAADDRVFVSFRAGRLLNRSLRLDVPTLNPTLLLGAHPGNEQEVGNGGVEVSLAELEDGAVRIAARQIEDIFWIFGLGNELILPVQRRLLGNTEPRAFPAG